MITHGHRDHIEDIFSFLDLRPLVLYTPRHFTDSEIRDANRANDRAFVDQYLKLRAAYSFPVPFGASVELGDGYDHADFKLFSPQRSSRKNLNDHSLVVVISYAGVTILIPGDNEPASWRELLEDRSFVRAIQGTDVLIASHHGRESGYCSELFDSMYRQPKLVVISDGRFCDTSATSRYCSKVTGWTVFDPSGDNETRYCLTTRKDGHVTIRCGWNLLSPGSPNYLGVTTSNKIERSLSSAIAALRYRSRF